MRQNLVLLMNIGSPKSPEKKDVARYLREFLTDSRVIDVPFFLRHFLVKGIIVPLRAAKSSMAYKSIWTKAGSPLVAYTQELAAKLENSLNKEQPDSHQFTVKTIMRYGSPNLDDALASVGDLSSTFEKIIIVPLYPQFSAATTGSSLAHIYKFLGRTWNVLPNVAAVGPFYDDAQFVHLSAEHIRQNASLNDIDHLLFSYHGLPERHIIKSCSQASSCRGSEGVFHDHCNIGQAKGVPLNCYRAQCQQFTQILAQQLNLPSDRYSWSFQSRLGRQKWLSPYTSEIIHQLREQGIKNLAIYSPAFVTDCLETLEEIAIALKESWHKIGGEGFKYIPSLNSADPWVSFLHKLIFEKR